MDLQAFLNDRRKIVEDFLRHLVRTIPVSGTLKEAMEYSLLGGGKRLRPILATAVCEAAKGTAETVMPYACAIEMIHTYSLIHDDLPCMDDDDLRRGRPTCHVVYGEAVALLAGDALLTEAFRIMANQGCRDRQETTACRIISEVAHAAGAGGMVGGQVLDVLYEGQEATRDILDAIHRNKTAALIRAAVLTGALVAGAGATELSCFATYGDSIGLAFQIRDDILDVDGDEAQVGKRLKKDEAKQTYVRHYGIEASTKRIDELIAQAIASIEHLGPDGEMLVKLAQRMGNRSS